MSDLIPFGNQLPTHANRKQAMALKRARESFELAALQVEASAALSARKVSAVAFVTGVAIDNQARLDAQALISVQNNPSAAGRILGILEDGNMEMRHILRGLGRSL